MHRSPITARATSVQPFVDSWLPVIATGTLRLPKITNPDCCATIRPHSQPRLGRATPPVPGEMAPPKPLTLTRRSPPRDRLLP
jgi:hypothetical protein